MRTRLATFELFRLEKALCRLLDVLTQQEIEYSGIHKCARSE
jgi:hypothetical protein